MPIAKAKTMSPEEMVGKMAVGRLYQVEGKPELCDEVYALMTASGEGLSSEAKMMVS